MRVPDVFDRMDAEEEGDQRAEPPHCNRCGEEIRWRQQGGKWVAFSLVPGREHHCAIDATGFGPIED